MKTMNFNLFKSNHTVDTSEVVDPTSTKGIDRKTVMILLLGCGCLITAILVATNQRGSAPVMATAPESVDPTYGGLFEVPSQQIVDESDMILQNHEVPPDWAVPMGISAQPVEEQEERREQFLAAIRKGGGLFMNKKNDRDQAKNEQVSPTSRTTTNDRTLLEGTTIDAVLETALNSDRPGPVSARVLNDITDTRTLSNTLIPAGTKVLGNMTPAGDAIALTWHRLIFPDGSTMMLDQIPSIDSGGGGLAGTVDRHRMARIGNAVMIAMLGATTALGGAQLSEHGGLIGGALALQLGQTGGRTMQQVRRPPTVKVPAGHAFQIWITQDLHF